MLKKNEYGRVYGQARKCQMLLSAWISSYLGNELLDISSCLVGAGERDAHYCRQI